MTVRRVAMAGALTVVLLAGCNGLPGKPKESDRPLSPSQVKSFAPLYAENCAGCHGADGQFGAATNLANPVYQALIDDSTLTRTVGDGLEGTPMPPFAHGGGGYLTADQITIIVKGMRERWRTGGPLQNAPPYQGSGGDAGQGAQAFAQSCAPCHGMDGKGGSKAPGSIVDPSYLVLVSDRALRTLVIAGRPDLGHPDWRSYPGGPLSAQQVSDVVAWFAAKRPRFAPGNYAQK
jgi:cytochrome c oxidase cbb3-type subunit 3/ubiquinol-cytochrome c reductase cytochrome c subunit